MTLESLQYVYAAYQYGSYKEAAYSLSVTYSVVAKQVFRVEEELGVRLFERASKSKDMQLTPAGEMLIGEIETILKAYDRMHNSIEQFSREKRKKLRIGYGQYFPCEEEMELLIRFSRKYPNIALSQKSEPPEDLRKQLSVGILNGVFVALLGENADQKADALFPATLYDRDIVSRTCNFHFLMSQKNPLAGRTQFTKEDREALLEQTILIVNTADSETKRVPPYLPEYLGVSREGMKVRFFDSTNVPLLPYILQEGNYLYPTARRFTRQYEKIVGVPVADWTVPVCLFVVSLKDSLNPALHLFRQCVREFREDL